MADQLEEIKQKVDIVALISERIEVKKAGRNFKALCPFHNEKTPSFMISQELGIYKCFGCGAGGDAISFLEKYEGMDFNEALKYLAEKVGVKLIPRNFEVGGEKEKLYQINKLAARFYNWILFNHPAGKVALDYLTKRKIKEETIKTFCIGYALSSSSVFSNYFVGKKRHKVEDLEKVGLIYRRGSRIIERFAGRIVFPLFDHKGNVVGFSGRVLPGMEKADIGKYINTPETPIYHKSNVLFGLNLVRREIKSTDEVVVVEGELDMISPWQAGVKNVVAIKGSALTEEQARLLSRFTSNIVLALDSDSAGNIATKRGIEILEKEGFKVKVAILGQYKDPDEAAIDNPGNLLKIIKDAVPIWDFIIDLAIKKYDPQTGEGKAEISRELVPVLSKISDEIVQAHYINRLSAILFVPYDAVLGEIRKRPTGNELQMVKNMESGSATGINQAEVLENRVVALGLLSKPEKLINEDLKLLLNTPLAKRVIEEYLTYSKKNKKFSLSDFSKYLSEELKQGFSEMIIMNSEDIDETYSATEKEFETMKKRIKLLNIEEKLEKLATEIGKYERAKEIKNLKNAEIEFNKLSKEKVKLEGSSI